MIWSVPKDISDTRVDRDAKPQVTSPADGTLAVTWRSRDDNTFRVQAAVKAPDASTWSATVNLSTADGGQHLRPQITATPRGTIAVTWCEWAKGWERVYVSTLERGDGVWSEAADLSGSKESAITSNVVAGPDGTIVVVWSAMSADDGSQRVRASRRARGTATWSEPQYLSDAGENAFDPKISACPDGSFAVVWHRYIDDDLRVQASILARGADVWSPPATLSAPGESAREPQIVASPDSTLAVAWQRGIGASVRVQVSTHRPEADAWSFPIDLSAPEATAMNPQLAATPNGTFAVTWHSNDGSRSRVQVSVLSTDAATWSSPITLSVSDEQAGNPHIAATPEGVLAVAWSTSKDDFEYRVQVSTRAAGATDNWTSPVDISAPGESAQYPRIVASLKGSLVSVWCWDDGETYRVQMTTTR